MKMTSIVSFQKKIFIFLTCRDIRYRISCREWTGDRRLCSRVCSNFKSQNMWEFWYSQVFGIFCLPNNWIYNKKWCGINEFSECPL